jgi:O-antigen/teichoic acid export membrane protein
VLDYFYHGKYGTANSLEFMILSLCIPFQFYINILWTLGFAAKRYKENTRIIAITAVSNVALNLLLIPLYGGNGAALGFFLTSILQLFLYYRNISRHIMVFSSKAFVVFLLVGIASYFVSVNVTSVVWLQLVIASVMYVGISMLSRQLHRTHWDILFSFLKK